MDKPTLAGQVQRLNQNLTFSTSSTCQHLQHPRHPRQLQQLLSKRRGRTGSCTQTLAAQAILLAR